MRESKPCILIADDEERILRALKDLLTARGFHVLTAADGYELTLYYDRAPDEGGQVRIIVAE